MVIVAVCVLASSAFAANLIKNGGFEKPVVPTANFTLFATGQTFPHWTVVGASGNMAIVSNDFSQNGFTFHPKGGKQFVDLTGTSNTPTGIAQTVATTPGAAYTLTFFVGNVVNPGGIFGTTSTVNVLVNGTQVFTATNSQGKAGTGVWQKFTTTITATSAQTTIAFINGDPPGDTANGLDSVSLVLQVP